MTGPVAADLAAHAARLLVGTGIDAAQAMRVAAGDRAGDGLVAAALRDGWQADETRQGEQG